LQAAAFAPKRLATQNKGSRWLNRLTVSIHRGDLQQSQASFGTRLSEPATVWGRTHPAVWQIRSLIFVLPQGRTPI
jgi:hypothetical protein